MKKHQSITGILIITVGLFSCNPKAKKETEAITAAPQTEVTAESSVPQISIEDLDAMRSAIESLEITPVEVTTSGLREKIKQKWSNIHFYVQNDKVVKVKTYPYPEISKRTEEFYANEDGLVLVVIEDDGEGTKGKSKNDIDKMYYFHKGKLLEELKKNEKSEYTVKESDAEELLSEFNEYLEIYAQQKK